MRVRQPYDLAIQKPCYFQMLLNIEKSGEQDLQRSTEWLVNTDTFFLSSANLILQYKVQQHDHSVTE